MNRQYVTYLSVGIILGSLGYIVVGTLFFVNLWAQNVLADLATR